MNPRVGDLVKFEILPDWVGQLPDESQRVFRYCLGRIYSVSEIDKHGLLILDVSKDIDERFGGFMNDIRLEPKYVTKVDAKGVKLAGTTRLQHLTRKRSGR